MRKLLIIGLATLVLACSENKQQQVDNAISKTGDSLIAKLNDVNDTLKNAVDSVKSKLPKVKVVSYKEIPITLQWIGWDTPGKAKLEKLDDGWFRVKGEQTNKANEFLKIDGKLKRIDANSVTFDGTVITYVKFNNGGKPCEKSGGQVFSKTGTRKYYRLRNMTNCEGGQLVDYVDLFDLDQVF